MGRLRGREEGKHGGNKGAMCDASERERNDLSVTGKENHSNNGIWQRANTRLLKGLTACGVHLAVYTEQMWKSGSLLPGHPEREGLKSQRGNGRRRHGGIKSSEDHKAVASAAGCRREGI